MTLKTRNAIVTGSTSGIGLAIAAGFRRAKAPMSSSTASATPTRSKKSAAGIEKDFGVKAIYSPADVTKPEEIRGMVKDGGSRPSAASTFSSTMPASSMSIRSRISRSRLWDKIIALNLSAAFHAIAAAIPGMKARKWGRIISTASAHSKVASPFKSAYVSAKHGIDGLTKTAALELATFGVTVNCISPGYVWTPLVEKQIPDTMKARNLTREQVINDVLLTAQPTKEFVTVDQVAALAVFLCTDAASQITGANISIDGGWTAE